MKTKKDFQFIKGQKVYKVFLSAKSKKINDYIALVIGKNKDDAKKRFLALTNETSKRLAQKYISVKVSEEHNLSGFRKKAVSGLFTNKSKKLVNVAIRPDPENKKVNIFGLFDMEPPTLKLRFFVLAAADSLKTAIEKARTGKYAKFVSLYETEHKMIDALPYGSLSGTDNNYMILYNKKYFYYDIVPIIGLITTSDRKAAQLFDSRPAAELKINKLPKDHRRKSQVIEA